MKTPSEKTLEHSTQAAELAQITIAAMRCGVSFGAIYCDNFRPIAGAGGVVGALDVSRDHLPDEAHFDAGRDAYRDGFRFDAYKPSEWRRGWIAEQRVAPRDRTPISEMGKRP